MKDSTEKGPVVPKLNLKAPLPVQNWASIKPARAKDIYLDNSVEKKYNPSNSEEGLLIALHVDVEQSPPKEHPQVNLQTN
jgi:hypothetical protein